MSSLTADQLAALARYDTPTVCNAIELFDVAPGQFRYSPPEGE